MHWPFRNIPPPFWGKTDMRVFRVTGKAKAQCGVAPMALQIAAPYVDSFYTPVLAYSRVELLRKIPDRSLGAPRSHQERRSCSPTGRHDSSIVAQDEDRLDIVLISRR